MKLRALFQSNRARALLAILLALLLAAPLAGCAKRGPTQKEMAKANWNEARARVLLNLAEDQYRHGNLKDSRKTTGDGLKLSDRVTGLYILHAKLDIEDGQLQAAAGALAVARKLEPKNPEVYYLSGIIAERWQQSEEALAAYSKASELAPTELAYLLAMAEGLMALDRAQEAAAVLEDKVVFFESSAHIRDMLAQIYQDLDRHAEAAEYYRQAALLAPEDPTLRERQALALVQAGEWNQAAELLERLIARPEHAEKIAMHIALGECRLQTGAAAAARAAYSRATRIDARNVQAWIGVAKSSLEQDDLPRVAYALDQAESLRPGGTVAGDLALLRGYLLLKEDRVEDASGSFATASRLLPQDSTPLLMYGLCQQRLGRLEEARRYYARALELDPSDTLARDLMNAVASNDRGLVD